MRLPRCRWAPVALALLLLNQPAMGGDDDEDDGGPGFRSEGGTCDKACTLGALPPVSAGTYVNNWPVRSLEKICNSSTSLTTAQPQDGLGGEVLARLAFRANSIQKGLLYLHTPFYEVDHVKGHEAAIETFMNLGADEIDIRSIKGDFVVHNEKDDIWNKVQHGCSDILTCVSSGSCMDHITPAAMEASMDEMRERYRRGAVKPELPWKAGEVYAVAVHLRRGDKQQMENETVLARAMDTVKKAVDDAGENHGQPIMFHIFTQGKEDLTLLANRSDTVMHYAKDTVQHGSSTEEAVAGLKLAFHSFVMADALIVDKSQLSVAAGWLSTGWVWGFGFNRARMGGNDWNLFDGNGVITKEKIKPPKWPRQAPARHHRRLASRRSLLVDAS